MPEAKVHELRIEMGRAEAQRLQPHHIQSFFVQAFQHLGGRLKEREEGRWEIMHVPVRIRERDRQIGSGAVIQKKYERVIAADIDGVSSTPYKIDQSAPNLNKYSATRRIARSIFMGSAPTHKEQNKGLDDRQINLGVVQPGERPAIFGDALRRLTNQAKFMHSDLGRYWYGHISQRLSFCIKNAYLICTIVSVETKKTIVL